jgi:hypothetical protein
MGIKMIDDLIAEYGDEEIKKAYKEYCDKLDKAPAPCSFIICSAELAEILKHL